MIPVHRQWCNGYVQMTWVLILFALGLGATMSTGQQPKSRLPTVTSATVPFYPPLARVARIEGIVHLRVSTDGMRVSAASTISGHPLLVEAAAENLRTWQFREHTPATFETMFRYKMLPESECEMDSGTVLLRLPAEVELSAKGWKTCDPVESGH